MSRFKLIIEYEGTRYSGWQLQKNARTIQGEINKATCIALNTNDFEIYGSGRTDAGVHALAQVAHLDVQTMLAPDIIRMKINDELPADIALKRVEKASSRFHARHDAISRSYIYQISRRRTALGKRYVWWIKDNLDVNLIEQASEEFVGMHDFRSFTSDDPEEKSTKVVIESCKIATHGDLIVIRIIGSHFLWNMVRRMVGVMAGVGRKKLNVEDVRMFLKKKSVIPASHTAPPSGLFLENVYYRNDIISDHIHQVMNI